MAATQFLTNVAQLAALIPHGAKIALYKDCGVPMAIGRALIRRGIRNLHVVTVPTGGMLPDMLIGAGTVATIETSGVSLGEFGLAPRFIEAVRHGEVRILDATCPAIYAGLQAAEKGIPFMPLRGLIGSDIVAHRPDFRVIDNPFGDNDPLVCLPAITPDFALLHAPFADSAGNVYVGRQKELKLLAHAARATLVTVERFVDFNLMDNDELAAGALSSLYVTAVAAAPRGAAPSNLPGYYEFDSAALKTYAQAAQSRTAFDAWLAREVDDDRVAAA